MIRIMETEQARRDFLETLEKVSRGKAKRSRNYVFRTEDGELFVGFYTQGRKRALLSASEEGCRLLTDDEDLLRAARQEEDSTGIEELCRLFVEYSADDLYALERLEDRIASLEDELFCGGKPGEAGLRKIYECRKEVLSRKRYYEQMELLTDDLAELDARFLFLDRRFDKLYRVILRIQEYVQHVSETYQAQTDIEQNRLMKFFTVVTAIFMPLTLITGWFGMNLIMPEFRWRHGYPYVIGLSVLVVVVMIALFKRKKWL